MNPTCVNGQTLQQSERLKHGDVISILDRSFRFVLTVYSKLYTIICIWVLFGFVMIPVFILGLSTLQLLHQRRDLLLEAKLRLCHLSLVRINCVCILIALINICSIFLFFVNFCSLFRSLILDIYFFRPSSKRWSQQWQYPAVFGEDAGVQRGCQFLTFQWSLPNDKEISWC